MKTKSRKSPLTLPEEHCQGFISAPVTLTVYSDFECPSCVTAHRVVKKLRRELGPNMRFVFKQFPLIDIHPSSLRMAQAAEGAGLQGKFWEMHDFLFESEGELTPEDLIEEIDSLGMDWDRFVEDASSKVVLSRIQRDIADGMIAGVEGTPTFLIDGVIVEGKISYQTLLDSLMNRVVQAMQPKERAASHRRVA